MISGVFSIPLPANSVSSVPSPGQDTDLTIALHAYIGDEPNRLCRVAVEAFFRDPPGYNPLVFVGAPGTGKSLLVRGLAARWKQENKNAKIVATTGSDFARQWSHAGETDSLPDLRAKYRRATLLMIDDLDAIGDRPAAQYELAQTLDTLVGRGHRVLISLAQAPAECLCLSAALASRLSAGLVVPLVAPGPAARRTIVEQLAQQHQLILPERVLDLLSGALMPAALTPPLVADLQRIVAELAIAARQQEQPVDAELVRQLLSTRVAARKTPLQSITRMVCKYFRLRTAELKGPTRRQRVVRARGIAMLLARQLTDESLEQLGRHFGNRDHTTVLHACRKTQSLIRTDPALRQAVEALTVQLSAP